MTYDELKANGWGDWIYDHKEGCQVLCCLDCAYRGCNCGGTKE